MTFLKISHVLSASVALVAGSIALGCSSDKTTSSGSDSGTSQSANDASASTSDANNGQGGPCNGLCTASGFTAGGTETDFKNGLVECQCAGTDGTVQKVDCENYCSTYGVPPADSLLSGTDKCACDGT